MNQAVAQTVDTNILLQLSAPGDRNLAPLLGDDDSQGVGVVGNPYRSSMARS